MNNREMKEYMKAVEEVIRCPICLEDLCAPIIQCNNGHGVCSQCKDATKGKCSICQQIFIKTPMRQLEQLIKVLPRPCLYSASGCDSYYVLNSHTDFCYFRPIKCRVGENSSCIWKGKVKDFGTHVKQSHNRFINVESKHVYVPLNEDIKLTYANFRNWKSCGYLLVSSGTLFLILVTKKDKFLRQTVKQIPMSKPECEYYFQITLRNGSDVLYKSKIEVTTLKEDQDSDVNHFMDIIMEDFPYQRDIDIIFNITKKDKV